MPALTEACINPTLVRDLADRRADILRTAKSMASLPSEPRLDTARELMGTALRLVDAAEQDVRSGDWS